MRLAATGVGVDLDHTLLSDNRLERVAFLRMLEDVVLYGGKAGTLEQESQRVDELLAQQRAGLCSIDDAVRRFFAERDVEPLDSLVAKFKAMAVSMADTFVVPVPGARAAIRSLRERGYPVVILTNGWQPLQQRKAAAAGFDLTVLASAEIGEQKPSPKAFTALVETLGIPRASCWYVGEDPRIDVIGAIAAGLRAVWLDTEGRAYPSGAPAPTRTIHAITELVEAIQGAGTAS